VKITSSSPMKLEAIFNGARKTLKVPQYQRPYSWKAEELNELWQDIISSQSRGEDYFFGPLVLLEYTKTPNRYDIVDGQQRLASFTILICVIRSIFKQFMDNPTNDIFDIIDNNQEQKDIAINGYVASVTRIQSKPGDPHGSRYIHMNAKDDPTFLANIQASEELLTGNELKLKPADRIIIKAKKYFTNQLTELYLSKRNGLFLISELLDHISTRILLLPIHVEDDADAYLLFESLNSKGIELSAADLLKNRVLAECKSNKQKQARVIISWDSMIDVITQTRFTPVDYLRIYWTWKHGPVTKKQLYKEIRKCLIEPNTPDVEKQVKDWAEAAQTFAEMTNAGLLYPSTNYQDDRTGKALAEINLLRYNSPYTLFLECKKVKPKLYPEIVETVRSFLFRVITISGKSVKVAEEAMSAAMNALKDKKPDAIVMKAFIDRDVSDDEFKKAMVLQTVDNARTARYIWCKVHEHKHGDTLIVNAGAINVEHVLPQSPKKWSDFDTKGMEIDVWINHIGNIALLEKGLNQAASNNTFVDKLPFFRKRTTNHPTGTQLPETFDIYEQYIDDDRTEWNADWIEERANMVADASTIIWAKASKDKPSKKKTKSRKKTKSKKKTKSR
jgi:uncharacterized protein with ParB-like and HNH nuclease domain